MDLITLNDVGVKARVAAFDQRHGAKAFLEGWWYFADGACREGDPLGALMEPPVDDWQRLSNVLNYHKGQHLSAVAAFDELREHLMHSATDKTRLQELKKLQRVVQEKNAAVEKAKAALANTSTGRARAAYQQQIAEERQRQAEWMAEVKSVRI